MSQARFTDPDLQAIYTYLAPPATGRAQAASAEAVAIREGLELAADLAAVQRRAARTPADRQRANRSGRRSVESQAAMMLSRRAEHLRGDQLRARARTWTRVGLWPAEMEAWIGVMGVDGAAIASACREAGITLPAMEVVLDGVRVRQRLRGGESVASVLARATSSGRSLSAEETPLMGGELTPCNRPQQGRAASRE
ncbi:hypothetical protein BEN35_19020 [Streptomyces fradiae]|nr:hypothetical protein BEN35_19020 [Streptomyces fradiae]